MIYRKQKISLKFFIQIMVFGSKWEYGLEGRNVSSMQEVLDFCLNPILARRFRRWCWTASPNWWWKVAWKNNKAGLAMIKFKFGAFKNIESQKGAQKINYLCQEPLRLCYVHSLHQLRYGPETIFSITF